MLTDYLNFRREQRRMRRLPASYMLRDLLQSRRRMRSWIGARLAARRHG